MKRRGKNGVAVFEPAMNSVCASSIKAFMAAIVRTPFLDELHAMEKLRPKAGERAVLVGDLNVAPLEHDVGRHRGGMDDLLDLRLEAALKRDLLFVLRCRRFAAFAAEDRAAQDLPGVGVDDDCRVFRGRKRALQQQAS